MRARALLLSCALLASGLVACLAQDSEAPATSDSTASSSLTASARQMVNVTVMYESYCKDCSWFITKELVPVYKQLRKHLILEMVPFGRARMREPQGADTTVSFSCRHGNAECQANMVHACAIALYPDPAVHLHFIACTLKAWKPEKNVIRCCQQLKLDSSKIQGCAASPQGRILLQKMGWRTLSVRPPINYVPSVIIDGGLNKRQQKKLQKEFKNTLCKHFRPPVPHACEMKKKRRGWFGRG